MSRLVVVSNRVADPARNAGAGGLAVAVGEALNEQGGIWLGWSGEVIAETDRRLDWQETRSGDVRLVTTPLSEHEYEGYYLGYSNQVLWPGFHYRLDLIDYSPEHEHVYAQVNRRLAQKLTTLLEPDDIIWVQDYHLIPLARELRAAGCGNPIGYFQHIPLPPPSVLSGIPGHESLMRALFAYDVVGFQTGTDRQHFGEIAKTLDPEASVEERYMIAFGRQSLVQAYPIGIDVAAFREMAETDEAAAIVERVRQRNLEREQIIGVDRLDYSKGLPERMEAMEKLLENYPENWGRTTFMQIAPLSREQVYAYSEIRNRLESLSGAINGRFSDFDWTPIRYINRNIPRATLAALFRASRVGLVTPLRDGMNLVAHEFVAAQDPEDPGVLVQSSFAGAAEYLHAALMVNPYNINEMANAIETALTMSLSERQSRYEQLYKSVRALDVSHWRSRFLQDLARYSPGGTA